MEGSTQETSQPQLDILILAAGLGTRMKSETAKVLHKLGGRPVIAHVIRTAAALDPRRIVVVVGHQAEAVEQSVKTEINDDRVSFALQEEQLGTGHAVLSARRFFENENSTLLILSGDVPMIRVETLAKLVQQHRAHRGRGAACTILTVKLDEPTGYGRVVRDQFGLFQKIVEQKDASEEERKIREINSGIYCFNSRLLFDSLTKVRNDNKQNEYYLTDAPLILSEAGEPVSLYSHNDFREVSGINNREELAEMEKILRRRINSRLMRDYGVTLIDPKHTYVSEDAEIGRDTIIHPNVTIEGKTHIGDGCEIRSGSRLTNAYVGKSVTILENCVVDTSSIGENCTIGPFAHIRNNAQIEQDAKIGNFVEVKKSIVGRKTKASHLTYLGDAQIGENTNIGAGTITCNYDGKNKNRTTIGSNVKIGSDTMLVAPVNVGDGAITGAGSVVTKDIPPNKLAVGAPAKIIKSLNTEEETNTNEA
ncbi:MAG TPA: bifunctional UDP-N-acetylglucosamine diphosphorylase/glucosamine-1-phosphate N-acetyltransferase GlmU [Pyrinomonadaceae bacterium]